MAEGLPHLDLEAQIFGLLDLDKRDHDAVDFAVRTLSGLGLDGAGNRIFQWLKVRAGGGKMAFSPMLVEGC